jgi:hypothetical protein
MQSPTIVSFGGGLNSTAMIVAMVTLGETIDAILFADTGGEKPKTYQHVKSLSDWVESKGYPSIITVRRNETLEDYCLERNMLPSLAYGFNQCSGDFKIKPIHQWVKNWSKAQAAWANGLKVTKCIGFDFGDRDRIRAAKFKDDYPSKYNLRFPLIEMQINREMCKTVIENAGLTPPEKSCCFFCPAHKKHEVVNLAKNNPDLFNRAIEIEDNAMSTLQTAKGLGRSFSWKTLIKSESEQNRLFDDMETPRITCVCGT